MVFEYESDNIGGQAAGGGLVLRAEIRWEVTAVQEQGREQVTTGWQQR